MASNVVTEHLSHVSTSPSSHTAIRDRIKHSAADVTSYWLISASVYITFGLLFFFASKEKLIDDSGTMPAGLAKSFHGTFIASFPGTNVSWVLVGLLEALVFVVIAASLVSGEFLPRRRKPLLLSGLGLSMFTFAVISVGENVTGQNATVAELFEYLVGTAVVIVLVLLMPPYRKTHWLSGLLDRDHAERDQV